MLKPAWKKSWSQPKSPLTYSWKQQAFKATSPFACVDTYIINLGTENEASEEQRQSDLRDYYKDRLFVILSRSYFQFFSTQSGLKAPLTFRRLNANKIQQHKRKHWKIQLAFPADTGWRTEPVTGDRGWCFHFFITHPPDEIILSVGGGISNCLVFPGIDEGGSWLWV